MGSFASLIAGPAAFFAEIIVAVAMFCRSLPRKRRFGARLAAVLLAGAAALVFYCWLVYLRYPSLMGRLALQTQIVTYTLVLVACVAAVMWLFEVSLWTALFCCTAGYIVQNAAQALGATLVCAARLAHADFSGTPLRAVLMAVALAVTYIAAYVVFVHPLEQRNLAIVENRLILLVVALVFLVNIVLNLVNVTLENYGVPLELVLILRLLHLVLCVFMLVMEYQMLYAKRLQDEVRAMQHLHDEEARQLRLSRENIDAVNERVAEVRSQVRRLEEAGAGVDRAALESISRQVGVYDSAVKTGNDILDIILAEKSLICEREGITLTCIADGAALSFMDQSDLYSLLGNAIENAIDAVSDLDERERRAIGLTVRRVGTGGAVAINVENYYEGELDFVDGLPQTTKGSELVHGFGMRAMRECVERYRGSLRASADGQVFHLNAIVAPRTEPGDKPVRVNALAAAAASRGISEGGLG